MVWLIIKNVTAPLTYAKKSYIPKPLIGASAIDKKKVAIKKIRKIFASELVLFDDLFALRVKSSVSAGINNSPAHKKWLCNEIPPR